MSEWKEYVFKDLFEIPLKNGLNKPSKVRGSGYRMVNMKEIFGYNFIGDDTPMELVPLDEREKEFLINGDLLFARQSLVASGAGKVAYFRGFNPTVFESHLIRCRIKKDISDSLFIYYLIKSPYGRSKIETIVEQTAAAGIRGSDLKELKFRIPSLKIQKSISEILSSLDDKIELNNKINQELETLAQTLFKQWFIDFEFPNENGVPYKSSGGAMVDSELGEIPKGWEVENLCEELKIVYGKNLPTTKLEVSGYDVFGGNGIIGKYHSYLYEDPQVLIACRGAASGKINISNRKSFVTNNSLVLDFTNSPSIQFTYLKYWSLFQDFTKCVSGSAQPQITIENLKSYLILVPNKNLVKIFSDTLSSTLEKINELNFENNQLEQLRDTLLPNLISGELVINEISN